MPVSETSSTVSTASGYAAGPDVARRAGARSAHGLCGDLVRPGGAVGFPCPGVLPGVLGVTLVVGCCVVGAKGVVLGSGVTELVLVGRSPEVGVLVGSVVGRAVSPGFGVSAA